MGLKRVFVLGLDGIPYWFLKDAFEKDRLPNLKRIFKNGSYGDSVSTVPVLSTVAWLSFLTSKNPGKHGIYGFIERRTNPFEYYIPTGKHLKAKTIFEYLSEAGKKVISINVPGTTPPKPINGVMVSGFLSVSLEKAVYPENFYREIEHTGYRIDINPLLAKKDPERFFNSLVENVKSRFSVFYRAEKFVGNWDFAILHIMETDRLLHFLWEHQKEGARYFENFWKFFEVLDSQIGELKEKLGEDTLFVALSDHGFTEVKGEVFPNYWLFEKGYLKFKKEKPVELIDLDSKTRVYSLIPGRFYINLLGREAIGSVLPEEYEKWREKLLEEIGQEFIEKGFARRVFKREEIYSGPYLENAPDLIILPENGFEYKGDLKPVSLFRENSSFSGTHAYEGAFYFLPCRIREMGRKITLYDLGRTILNFFGLSEVSNFDGEVLCEKFNG